VPNFSAFRPVDYFFYALLAAAFVIEAWAFIDALRHPTSAYPAVGKLSKPIWLLILGVALLVGDGGITGQIGLFTSFLALPIIAFVAAAVYLVEYRPKLKNVRARPGTRQGPYGPW